MNKKPEYKVFNKVWRVRKERPERFNKLCAVISYTRGMQASVTIEFEDGEQVTVPRTYIKSANFKDGVYDNS